MEKGIISELIDESIRLELYAAELYLYFCTIHPVDAPFWHRLHEEERNHAKLLRAAKDWYTKNGHIPSGLFSHSLIELKKANAWVEHQIQQCKEHPISRKTACRVAISVEKEAGESHFLSFMEKLANNPLETVFQQLNRNDVEHQQRILEYLNRLDDTDSDDPFNPGNAAR